MRWPSTFPDATGRRPGKHYPPRSGRDRPNTGARAEGVARNGSEGAWSRQVKGCGQRDAGRNRMPVSWGKGEGGRRRGAAPRRPAEGAGRGVRARAAERARREGRGSRSGIRRQDFSDQRGPGSLIRRMRRSGWRVRVPPKEGNWLFRLKVAASLDVRETKREERKRKAREPMDARPPVANGVAGARSQSKATGRLCEIEAARRKARVLGPDEGAGSREAGPRQSGRGSGNAARPSRGVFGSRNGGRGGQADPG